MAVGTTIALVSLALGAYSQVRGQIKQGQAARDAGLAQQQAAEASGRVADSQAEQLLFNAGVADSQAADSLQRGFEEESRYRASVRGLIGAQRANVAASNMAVGTGSSLDVQADTAHLGELDALTIRSNAKREAWGFRTEAQDLRMAADVARRGGSAARVGGQYAAAAGRQAQSAARWNAAGTILGTGSSLLLQKYGWGQP